MEVLLWFYNNSLQEVLFQSMLLFWMQLVCTNRVKLQNSFGKSPLPGYQVESARVTDIRFYQPVWNILFKIILKISMARSNLDGLCFRTELDWSIQFMLTIWVFTWPKLSRWCSIKGTNRILLFSESCQLKVLSML